MLLRRDPWLTVVWRRKHGEDGGAEQWLPAMVQEERLGFQEKMMMCQCFIGVDVFARINATWLVLVG